MKKIIFYETLWGMWTKFTHEDPESASWYTL